MENLLPYEACPFYDCGFPLGDPETTGADSYRRYCPHCDGWTYYEYGVVHGCERVVKEPLPD